MATKYDITSVYRLNSGHEIPALGFGVYRTPVEECKRCVLKAFEVGYRHIDSATAYHNEKPCGDAIRESGIPREKVFITTKIPPRIQGYEKAKDSINKSLKESGLDYFDLILIHAPFGTKDERLGSWKAMAEAQKAGKVRSLGVSNYGVHHLEELKEYIQNNNSSPIDVGQWELHPWLGRRDIVDWCRANNVVVEAYCPVVRAQRHDDPVVTKLANKHNRTPAQILLRWSLQMGFVPLPKSVTPSRIEENAQLYDFELSSEDMDLLTTDEYSPVAWDPTKDTQV
ncbi:aldo-keto reductase [Talaromyces proteolyticus]|uniref:D-xylose reductase [NAD(P)H] n=1 Tax=Talaromyces proteolyticus TaxID=1131652 RepID=A0AAD4PYT5_9EURO|nr:aldo-keto reductase [Talaromyces proteolyticus]KAH8694949.1 aldo-keto reductase [Talaromyces proteolyticus]